MVRALWLLWYCASKCRTEPNLWYICMLYTADIVMIGDGLTCTRQRDNVILVYKHVCPPQYICLCISTFYIYIRDVMCSIHIYVSESLQADFLSCSGSRYSIHTRILTKFNSPNKWISKIVCFQRTCQFSMLFCRMNWDEVW